MLVIGNWALGIGHWGLGINNYPPLRNVDLIKYGTSPPRCVPSPLTERGIKGVRFYIEFVLYFIHIPNHQELPNNNYSFSLPEEISSLGRSGKVNNVCGKPEPSGSVGKYSRRAKIIAPTIDINNKIEASSKGNK